MQLQKFVGDSMPMVLNSLKDALGSDAIILANRRVGDHIEIIATGTLDDASIDNAELFQVPNDSSTPSAKVKDLEASETVVETAVSRDIDTISKEAAELPQETVQQADAAIENNSDGDETTESSSHAAIVENSEQSVEHLYEAKDDVASTIAFAMEDNAASMAESIATEVNLGVDKKLESFHGTMNQRLSQLEANLWGEKDPVKSKHLQTLLEIGLGSELAVALVNRVSSSTTFDNALRQSLSDLANTLPVASDRTLTHKGATFVYGPNGSGKTTTLLKLAAQKVSISGADSVVIICADAKRTGVFESLTAHGNSLGLSVVRANTQDELQESLSFYASKELVLVDQSSQIEFIECPMPEELGIEHDVIDSNDRSIRHLLVLPATIQSSVAEAVVSEFSKHASARCVITNLDRACRVGELFTSIIRNNLRVAYWSECGDINTPLNKASATTLVASAMAMGKRLVPSEDDRYLMDLIHPRFSASVLPMFRANQ